LIPELAFTELPPRLWLVRLNDRISRMYIRWFLVQQKYRFSALKQRVSGAQAGEPTTDNDGAWCSHAEDYSRDWASKARQGGGQDQSESLRAGFDVLYKARNDSEYHRHRQEPGTEESGRGRPSLDGCLEPPLPTPMDSSALDLKSIG
jgi:hypothetical protein